MPRALQYVLTCLKYFAMELFHVAGPFPRRRRFGIMKLMFESKRFSYLAEFSVV